MKKKLVLYPVNFFFYYEKNTALKLLVKTLKIQFILLVHMGYKSVVYKRSHRGAQSAYELL